tara:strand:- start:1271 stop:1477 length:207 start_codon:yes stop_codon:yes gene_type:complete
MNTQNIKDEIYNYVLKLDLNKEELAHIDNYVKELLLYLTPLIESQEKVLADEEQFQAFKKELFKKIGD